MQNAKDRAAQFDGGFGSCCVGCFQLCSVRMPPQNIPVVAGLHRYACCSNHCSFLLMRREIMQTQPLRIHASPFRCAHLAGTLASNRVGEACYNLPFTIDLSPLLRSAKKPSCLVRRSLQHLYTKRLVNLFLEMTTSNPAWSFSCYI